jgi:acyl carrier protein
MSNVAERVKKLVVENLDAEELKITLESNFANDLGADSLDQVELVMAMEEEFGIEIPEEDAEKIQNFGSAVQYITERIQALETK